MHKTRSLLCVHPKGASTSHLHRVNLSPRLFVMYMLKFVFFMHSILTTKLALNRPSHQLHLRSTICLSVCACGKNILHNLFTSCECMCFMQHYIGKGNNDGRQSGSCLFFCFPRFLLIHVPMVTGLAAFLGLSGLFIKFYF